MLELEKQLDKKLEEYKKDMEYDMKMAALLEKQTHQENFEKLRQEMDEINKFSMITEIELKGYNTINEWFEQLSNDKIEKIVDQSTQYINKIMDQQDQINNQKLDNFLREQVIIKSQVDSFKEIRSQLAQMNNKIDEKATYQNLRNLEYQLEDYVKFNALKAVADSINSKCEQNDLDKLITELRSSQNHIVQIQQIVTTQQQTQEKIEQNLIENSTDITQKMENFELELKKLQADFQHKITQVKDMFKNYMREQEVSYQEMHNKLDFKASVNQMCELKDYVIEKYALQASLRDLRKEVIPHLQEFRKTMEYYNDGYAQIQEMVRRFDEVLSEKASKMAINELQFFVECNYVKKKYWDKLQEEINKTIEQQQQTVKVMQESVRMFEVNMSEEITNAVKKSLSKTMVNYEKVLNQFQKFFDQEELNKVLERKCDIEVVQTLQDIKANKIDLESCVGLVESIHARLKHMSIVTVELARSLLPVKSSNTFETVETKNALINRRDFLFKQAQVTAAWIEDFKIKQLQPGEQETISQYTLPNQQSQNSHQLQQKLSRVETASRINKQHNVKLSDIPSSLRKFEQFHLQQQDQMRLEMPQSIKRWKHQLSNKITAQHSSLQRQSIGATQNNFYEMISNLSDPKIVTENNLNNGVYLDYKKSLQHIATRRHKKSHQSMRISLNNSPINTSINHQSTSNNNNNNESYDLSLVLGGHGEVSVHKMRHGSASQYTPSMFIVDPATGSKTLSNQYSQIINKQQQSTQIDDQTAKRITIFRNNLYTKGSLSNINQQQQQTNNVMVQNDDMLTGKSKYLNESSINQTFTDAVQNKSIQSNQKNNSIMTRGIKTSSHIQHTKQYGI